MAAFDRAASGHAGLPECEHFLHGHHIAFHAGDFLHASCNNEGVTRRFEIGETAQLGAQQLRVLGRVVFSDGETLWDEWYVALPDGTTAWLELEDGQQFLSRKVLLQVAVPSFDATSCCSSRCLTSRM